MRYRKTLDKPPEKTQLKSIPDRRQSVAHHRKAYPELLAH